MPVAPTYPGVYLEELPSGVHTITGVSTAVTAFLGYFLQGPMNTAVRIFSVADLERTFGPLAAPSEAGYAVRQFFANGGAEAWVVRVAAPAPGTPDQPPATASVQIEDHPSGGTAILTATAASEGIWGNTLRMSVDYATTDPATRFNLTVSQVDASNPPVATATEVYRNLTLDPSDANDAVAVVNDASALVQLALVASTAATALPAATGTVSATDLTGAGVLAAVAGKAMDVKLGTTDLGTFTMGATAPASPTALAGALQGLLRALKSSAGVAAIPAATVTVVPGNGSAKVLQIAASVVAATVGEFLTFAGPLATALGLDTPASANDQQYALGVTPPAGAEGTVTTGADGVAPGANELLGDPVAKTGLYALDIVDGFNILCLPDVMNLGDTDAFAVIAGAEAYCTSRRAFYLVDTPQHDANRDQMDLMQTWLDQNATLRSSYAAVYYPRPQIPDPVNGYRLRTVASSGTIAGLYARTDSARGVWKAPAGTEATLTGVAALAYKLTDPETGALNPLGINTLRTFPVYGNVCWGGRTLDGADQQASDWRYIPIRRLALYIEESLYRGTQWVVFEPNDEPLWSQIRLNVGSFMRGLFQQGAFQGSTPAAAYFVKCDSETTTQADINLGVVNVIVGFAPLKPAEFVILQIQQIAGQIPT